MTDKYEHGPLSTFEVTWNTGHVETVRAHQCLLPHPIGFLGARGPEDPWITFHGEINGQWQLVLSAREKDVRSVRNVTTDESVPGGAS